MAPLVRPGLIEYPPRPGWPYEPRASVGPLRRIKLGVALVVLGAAVLLFIAYQVISGFLTMVNDLVN